MTVIDAVLVDGGSEIIYDTVSDLVKDSQHALEADLLGKSGLTGSEVFNLLGSLAGGFYTHLTLAILRRVLKIEDSGTKIEKILSKLVAAPMTVATSQLAMAMKLEPESGTCETDAQRQFRVDRYKNALISFDQARAFATPEEMLMIELCSGMVCSRIPGASKEATIHLNSYLRVMKPRYDKLMDDLIPRVEKWEACVDAYKKNTYATKYYSSKWSQSSFLHSTETKELDKLILQTRRMKTAIGFCVKSGLHLI